MPHIDMSWKLEGQNPIVGCNYYVETGKMREV